LWRAGQVLAAKRHFEQLIAKRPQDADALQMLARCQTALGRREEGLKLANLALRRAPGSPRALATRGEILLDSGKADLAHKDLRRAADGLPRDGRLLTRLAQACTEAEKPSCARRFFLYALRRDPKNAAAHFGIGLHYLHSKKQKRAKAAFQRAISLDPGNPSYRRVAARLAELHGDRTWSRRLLAEARHLERGARRFANRVKAANLRTQRQIAALVALQRSQTCIDRDCQRAVARAPLPARLFLKAHLALKKNKKALAAQLLETLRDRIKPRRLLLADPSLLAQKGKTLSGQWFMLRRRFPLVIPGSL
jgi:tetratricopeptide (TPR) repeat protein